MGTAVMSLKTDAKTTCGQARTGPLDALACCPRVVDFASPHTAQHCVRRILTVTGEDEMKLGVSCVRTSLIAYGDGVPSLHRIHEKDTGGPRGDGAMQDERPCPHHE